jgi:hypothetical protein
MFIKTFMLVCLMTSQTGYVGWFSDNLLCVAVVKPEKAHAGATLEIPSEEILSQLK